MSHEKAFDDGLQAVGGSMSDLAERMGESLQTLSNWRSRGVPANKCKRFEAVTGISVRRLRPADWRDYWPPEDERSKAKAA